MMNTLDAGVSKVATVGSEFLFIARITGLVTDDPESRSSLIWRR